jgi:hypothetical protein
MHVQSAVITIPGRSFRVVAVPKPILADQQKAVQAIHFLQARCVEMPIALVTRDAHGALTSYYGPGDLAQHLLRVPSTALRWSELSLT